MEYNIYCDESCHLEHDESNSMSLGAIWLPKDVVQAVNQEIRDIKVAHNMSPFYEAKWTKISPAKEALYIDLIDYFFNKPELRFRGLVVPDKSILKHDAFNQTHSEWYDKMYFAMLKKILKPENVYYAYPDKKDSHSYHRAKELQSYLCNQLYDFDHECLRRIQPIQSTEVQIMQIVDIMTGAIAYANRHFAPEHKKSSAKLSVISRIEAATRRPLTISSLYKNQKFNILIWESSKEVIHD